MNFTHSGGEARSYDFCVNILDHIMIYGINVLANVLTSFVGMLMLKKVFPDFIMYLQIASTDICDGISKNCSLLVSC